MLLARQFLQDQVIHRRPGAPANPRVSVVLPTYSGNWSGQLQRAINSVLRQTMPNFELLLVDDGSRDGTDALIRSLQQRDSRIVYIRHERNSGLPALRCNEGIELSRGEFIAFQFVTGGWVPQFLEILLKAASKQKRPALTCGQAHIQGHGRDLVLPLHAVSLGYLSEHNYVPNNAVLVPREFFDRVGMYDPHIAMRSLSDWDLWQRLAEVVPIHTEARVVAVNHENEDVPNAQRASIDQGLHCALHEIPRNHLLTPTTWRNYPLDSLTLGNTELRGEVRRAAYETQILPYYLRHRLDLPSDDFPLNVPPTPRTVGVVGDTAELDPLLNLDAATRRRDTYRLGRVRDLDSRYLDLALTANAPPETCLPVASINADAEHADLVWLAPGTRSAHPRTTVLVPGHPGDLASIHGFEAACRATELHGLTRNARHDDGRPVVLLAFGLPRTAADLAWADRAAVLRRYGFGVVAVLPVAARDSEPGRTLLQNLRQAGVAITWLDVPEILPDDTAMLTPSVDTATATAALECLLADHRPVVVESLGYLPAVGLACRWRNVPHLATLTSCTLARRPEMPEHAASILSDFCPEDPYNKLPATGLRWRCLRGAVPAEFLAVGHTEAPSREDHSRHRPLRVLLQIAPALPDSEIESLAVHLDHADAGGQGWELRILDRTVDLDDPRLIGCPLPQDRLRLLTEVDLLLVLPDEGIGQAVKEALAVGTLIVAADTPAMRELIHDEHTGLLVANREDWTATLRRAINLSREERNRIRLRGAALARAELLPERFASELLLSYLEAIRVCGTRTNRTSLSTEERAPLPMLGKTSFVQLETFDRCLRYEVVPIGPSWAGLEIGLDTARMTEAMPIHLEIRDSSGRLVRKATAEVGPGVDRVTATFRFAPLPCSGTAAFTVVLHPPASAGTGMLRLFEVVPAGQTLFERIRRKFLRGFTRTGLDCRLLLG